MVMHKQLLYSYGDDANVSEGLCELTSAVCFLCQALGPGSWVGLSDEACSTLNAAQMPWHQVTEWWCRPSPRLFKTNQRLFSQWPTGLCNWKVETHYFQFTKSSANASKALFIWLLMTISFCIYTEKNTNIRFHKSHASPIAKISQKIVWSTSHATENFLSTGYCVQKAKHIATQSMSHWRK